MKVFEKRITFISHTIILVIDFWRDKRRKSTKTASQTGRNGQVQTEFPLTNTLTDCYTELMADTMRHWLIHCPFTAYYTEWMTIQSANCHTFQLTSAVAALYFSASIRCVSTRNKSCFCCIKLSTKFSTELSPCAACSLFRTESSYAYDRKKEID